MEYDVLHKSLPFLGLLFVWAIIYITQRNKRHRSDAQRDVQLALLNKFSTGEEMARFLSTEEGRRLVDQLTAPSEDDPRLQAVGLVIPGCVLAALSIGFVVLAVVEQRDALFFPAVIIGAVALGLFAGAAVSLRIAKKLGLTKER